MFRMNHGSTQLAVVSVMTCIIKRFYVETPGTVTKQIAHLADRSRIDPFSLVALYVFEVIFSFKYFHNNNPSPQMEALAAVSFFYAQTLFAPGCHR